MWHVETDVFALAVFLIMLIKVRYNAILIMSFFVITAWFTVFSLFIMDG